MRVWGSFYAQNLRYHLEIFYCVLNDISSLAHRNSPKFAQIIHFIAIQLSGKFKENLPLKTLDFRSFHLEQISRKSFWFMFFILEVAEGAMFVYYREPDNVVAPRNFRARLYCHEKAIFAIF